MKTITIKILLPISAALLLTAGSAQAMLIQNGGFENGLDNWSVNLTSHGANRGGTNITPFDIDGDTLQSNAARVNVGRNGGASGSQHGVNFSQIFSVTAEGTHDVFASFASVGDNSGRRSNSDGGTFSLSIDNKLIDTYSIGRLAGRNTRLGSLSGSTFLTAGTHLLDISITRIYGNSKNTPYQYLDNISVAGLNPAPPAAVPEPSSLALLGLGVCGLAATRHRKRATVST